MQAKRILVTSAVGGVGKSSVSTHLSSALAEAGHRVLLVDLCSTGRVLDLLTSLSDAVLYDIGDLFCGRTTASRALLEVPSRRGLFLLPGLFRAEHPVTSHELLRAVRVAEEAIDAEYTIFDSHFDDTALRAASIADRVFVVSDLRPGSVRAAAEAALALPSQVEASIIVNRYPCYPSVKGKWPSVKALLDEARLPLSGILPDSPALSRREAAGDGISLPKENLSRAYRSIAARLDGLHAPLCIKWKKVKRKRLIRALIG